MDGVVVTPLKQIRNPKGDIFHAMKKSDKIKTIKTIQNQDSEKLMHTIYSIKIFYNKFNFIFR